MARSRFVQPETVVLPLSEGYTIEVKKRLSVGEERAAFASVVGEINTATGWRKPNTEMAGFAEMTAYIVSWNFTDAQGKLVPFSLSALKQLDAETYAEIEKAIEQHIAAMDVEEQARKNGQGSPKEREPTSVSAG